MRDEIISLLEEIKSDIDFDTCKTLMDDGLLSSLDVLQLIGALNDTFDISIPATEIVPANFNSVESIEAMVKRLEDE